MGEGIVYTLRARRRRIGVTTIVSKGGRVGVATVRLVGAFNLSKPEDLKPYLPYSGFSSIEEWVREFRRLNGNTAKAYLYEVKLIRTTGNNP